jgi:hypothetical protein
MCARKACHPGMCGLSYCPISVSISTQAWDNSFTLVPDPDPGNFPVYTNFAIKVINMIDKRFKRDEIY